MSAADYQSASFPLFRVDSIDVLITREPAILRGHYCSCCQFHCNPEFHHQVGCVLSPSAACLKACLMLPGRFLLTVHPRRVEQAAIAISFCLCAWFAATAYIMWHMSHNFKEDLCGNDFSVLLSFGAIWIFAGECGLQNWCSKLDAPDRSTSSCNHLDPALADSDFAGWSVADRNDFSTFREPFDLLGSLWRHIVDGSMRLFRLAGAVAHQTCVLLTHGCVQERAGFYLFIASRYKAHTILCALRVSHQDISTLEKKRQAMELQVRYWPNNSTAL